MSGDAKPKGMAAVVPRQQTNAMRAEEFVFIEQIPQDGHHFCFVAGPRYKLAILPYRDVGNLAVELRSLGKDLSAIVNVDGVRQLVACSRLN